MVFIVVVVVVGVLFSLFLSLRLAVVPFDCGDAGVFFHRSSGL